MTEYLARAEGDELRARGPQVETAETEAALLAHPAVGGAAVTARQGAAGQLRLVAYVAGHQGSAPPSADELRAFARVRLPESIVPSAFIPMTELPTGPDGTVDRQALPAPPADRSALTTEFVPARNPIERTLAMLWEEILGVTSIGVHDDFFDLGGHSLGMARLAVRLVDTFNVNVDLEQLLDTPTVAALAAHITGELAGDAAAVQVLDEVESLSDSEVQALLDGQ